jgi:hypothetical protein
VPPISQNHISSSYAGDGHGEGANRGEAAGRREPETARGGAAAGPAEQWRRRIPRREDADADRSLAVAMGMGDQSSRWWGIMLARVFALAGEGERNGAEAKWAWAKLGHTWANWIEIT